MSIDCATIYSNNYCDKETCKIGGVLLNIQEYKKVCDYTYLQYCDYLQKKYGIGLAPYMTKSFNPNPKCKRTKEGLIAHHKLENRMIMLSKKEIAETCPYEWQLEHNIVYCDYLEHMLLHILICKYPSDDTPDFISVGIGGIANFLIPELNDVFSGWITRQAWRKNCHDRIIDDREVYLALIEQFIECTKDHPYFQVDMLFNSYNENFGSYDSERNNKDINSDIMNIIKRTLIGTEKYVDDITIDETNYSNFVDYNRDRYTLSENLNVNSFLELVKCISTISYNEIHRRIGVNFTQFIDAGDKFYDFNFRFILKSVEEMKAAFMNSKNYLNSIAIYDKGISIIVNTRYLIQVGNSLYECEKQRANKYNAIPILELQIVFDSDTKTRMIRKNMKDYEINIVENDKFVLKRCPYDFFRPNRISSAKDVFTPVDTIIFSDDTNVTIPDEYNVIRGFAFEHKPYKFVEVNQVKRIEAYAFTRSNIEKIVIPSNVKFLDGHSFQYCKTIKEAIIKTEEDVLRIEMFDECESLQKVVLPKSIKVIKGKCFRYCVNLQEVNLENIDEIGTYAFYQCRELKQVRLKKICKIDKTAFRGCDKLKIIYVD